MLNTILTFIMFTQIEKKVNDSRVHVVDILAVTNEQFPLKEITMSGNLVDIHSFLIEISKQKNQIDALY